MLIRHPGNASGGIPVLFDQPRFGLENFRNRVRRGSGRRGPVPDLKLEKVRPKLESFPGGE